MTSHKNEVLIKQSKTDKADHHYQVPRLPLSCYSPYLTHGFNFMIAQDSCLISSHHIHILTSRKKEKVRVKESIPFSYGNF